MIGNEIKKFVHLFNFQINLSEAIKNQKKKLRNDESFWLIFSPCGFKVRVYTLHFILLKAKCLTEISSLKSKFP